MVFDFFVLSLYFYLNGRYFDALAILLPFDYFIYFVINLFCFSSISACSAVAEEIEHFEQSEENTFFICLGFNCDESIHNYNYSILCFLLIGQKTFYFVSSMSKFQTLKATNIGIWSASRNSHWINCKQTHEKVNELHSAHNSRFPSFSILFENIYKLSYQYNKIK